MSEENKTEEIRRDPEIPKVPVLPDSFKQVSSFGLDSVLQLGIENGTSFVVPAKQPTKVDKVPEHK